MSRWTTPPAPPPYLDGIARFQALARGAAVRSLPTTHGVDLEKFVAPRPTPPRTPKTAPGAKTRTLKEHRRAQSLLAAERRRSLGDRDMPVSRTGVGNMGTLPGGKRGLPCHFNVCVSP